MLGNSLPNLYARVAGDPAIGYEIINRNTRRPVYRCFGFDSRTEARDAALEICLRGRYRNPRFVYRIVER